MASQFVKSKKPTPIMMEPETPAIDINYEERGEPVKTGEISHSDEVADLIAELCVYAKTENVKKSLRCYKYGKSILK